MGKSKTNSQSNKARSTWAKPHYKPAGADHLLTIKELCHRLGISRPTCNRLMHIEGALPKSFMVGCKRYFPVHEVENWINSRLA